MNYEKIYWDIVRRGIAHKAGTWKRENFELHHVIPKEKGGTDKSYNLIPLTVREHIFAHMLLARMGCARMYTTKHSSRYFTKRRVQGKNFMYFQNTKTTKVEFKKALQALVKEFFPGFNMLNEDSMLTSFSSKCVNSLILSKKAIR